MVRSQLIIVTNSTQMQERLLTELDTCPCKKLLFAARRQNSRMTGGGQLCWHPGTETADAPASRHEPRSAWWHLNPSVQGTLVLCPTVAKGSIFLYDARRNAIKVNSPSPFPPSVDQLLISWSLELN